jgi:hypothetical protein
MDDLFASPGVSLRVFGSRDRDRSHQIPPAAPMPKTPAKTITAGRRRSSEVST